MKWLLLKLDNKQCCLQNTLPVLEILSYSKAISTFHPKIYFQKRSWHHLCVNQVTVLPLPGVFALEAFALIQFNKCLLEAYYMQGIFQMLVVE